MLISSAPAKKAAPKKSLAGFKKGFFDAPRPKSAKKKAQPKDDMPTLKGKKTSGGICTGGPRIPGLWYHLVSVLQAFSCLFL